MDASQIRSAEPFRRRRPQLRWTTVRYVQSIALDIDDHVSIRCDFPRQPSVEELVSKRCPEFKAKIDLSASAVARVVFNRNRLPHQADVFKEDRGTRMRDKVGKLEALDSARILLDGNPAQLGEAQTTSELVAKPRRAENTLIKENAQLEPVESIRSNDLGQSFQ